MNMKLFRRANVDKRDFFGRRLPHFVGLPGSHIEPERRLLGRVKL